MKWKMFEGRTGTHMGAVSNAESQFAEWRKENQAAEIKHISTSAFEFGQADAVSAIICVWYD